ncbi:MAG: hypothetical protein KDA84_05075, partial [Planctomycetaceae bacterium]|nr:hypothetical protein [Planctomycetaceae bacterium]
EQLTFHPSAFQVAERLKPWLCHERRTNRWPGTKLGETLAWVRCYQITSQSMAFLQQVSGLFQWKSPHFPEDLVFYLEDGQPWLVSITHEGRWWFDRNRMDAPLAQSFLKRLRRHGVFDNSSSPIE